MIFPETRVAVTPFQSGYRLGSTMEFAGYDESIRPERLQLLKDGAEPYLREPYCEPVEEQWYGWRPMTYDSLPIIDRSPRYENVFIAAGHNMLGLSMAPATGKLVAEMVNGSAPHIDPKPYRVESVLRIDAIERVAEAGYNPPWAVIESLRRGRESCRFTTGLASMRESSTISTSGGSTILRGA